jgi:hypothetical protein
MCSRVSYKKKMSDPDPLVRGPDPDQHQNDTDPQHWQNKKCFAFQAACKESQKQYMPVKLDEVGIKL